MVIKELVPVTFKHMNRILVEHHKGTRAKLYWGDSSCPEIFSMPDLKALFLQQQQKMGKKWLLSDMNEAIHEAKKESSCSKSMDPNQALPPDSKTVNTYHSALTSEPDITLCVKKEKDVHYRIGETSPWSMLSNHVVILLVPFETFHCSSDLLRKMLEMVSRK